MTNWTSRPRKWRMWTTICNQEKGYQALNPREWLEIVNEVKPQKEIMEDFFADKFCPDK